MFMEEKQNSLISQDSDVVYPKKEKEVSDIIKKFYKSNIPIEIVGSGSKRLIGKPLQCGKTLNLSMLDGIIEYKPEELYIKVKAGTPIDKIESELSFQLDWQELPKGQEHMRAGKGYADKAKQYIPIGIGGIPDNIANMAVALCTSVGNYVNGQTITVDGGLLTGFPVPDSELGI